MKTKELLLYRNFKYQDLFDNMAALLEKLPAACESCDEYQNEEAMPDSYTCASQLVELASAYGFEGNLWHCFLALCIAESENAFSKSCEVTGKFQGTLNFLAAKDMEILGGLFQKDIALLDREGENIWKLLCDYHMEDKKSPVFNTRVRDRILELSRLLENAENIEKFQEHVVQFYKDFGVGKFGLNKAFQLKEQDGQAYIEPITRIEHVYLKDLVGYELQKQKLIENTESFINGKGGNNVLLYGDAGTGKSSSVKAILNEYYSRGLRIIEVYKHQFQWLSGVLEQVKDRKYKFIIYMDDLSFEDFELEYKYLKAILEGGLGRKPDNVLIYATSNRRHLIREKFSDKREISDDLHGNDTVQEKLSLAARFGVTIYYGAPEKKEFQQIVKALAERNDIHMEEEELLLEANKWELHHGGLSGRTAAQFITYLQGKQ